MKAISIAEEVRGGKILKSMAYEESGNGGTKVYCCGQPDNTLAAAALMRGSGDSDKDAWPMMAMMNGGMNGQWNNPFVYLVWMMFAQRMWGANGFGAGGENPQLAAIQAQMNTNQNSELIVRAIDGNRDALSTLASNLNCDFNTLNAAICDVRGGIDKLAGQIGFSAERVINAVQTGNSSVIQAIQNCCCENRLAICQQTNTLQTAINNVATGQERGFAAVAYETQRQTCDLLNAGEKNTQRIIDTLNAHWTADLQQRYNDARLELSQLRQNKTLIAALKTSSAS